MTLRAASFPRPSQADYNSPACMVISTSASLELRIRTYNRRSMVLFYHHALRAAGADGLLMHYLRSHGQLGIWLGWHDTIGERTQ